MRTTIDIPDQIFRELKLRAASEGRSVREIVLEGVGLRLKGASSPEQTNAPRFPTIKSSRPGSLKLGEEGVYEYIPFP
jgi:plasmid stability protein